MKWLGWLNIYFAVTVFLIVVYLLLTHNKIADNKIPVVEKQIPEKELAELKQVVGEVRAGYDVAKLIQFDDAKLAKGKEVYAANCAGCHGANGTGDGMPTARDFSKTTGWTAGHTLADVFEVLTNGNAKGMPSYGTLSVDDRMAVGQYIRTLGKGYEEAGAADIATLNSKFGLSEAKKQANQIPVESAIEKIAEESNSAPRDTVQK